MNKTEGRMYPLMENDGDYLRAASGRAIHDIDLGAADRGDLTAEDLQIAPETLRVQAELARNAGYRQLAENLRRAAELTAVPNEELLVMYELLRPSRATYEELMQLGERLVSEYSARETAAFVQEAAEVYRMRGLARTE